MLSRRLVYGLLLGAAALAVAFAPLPFETRVESHREQTFNIEARQFSYAPSVLQVAAGDTVTIHLVSTDVVHGLYLDGYGLSVQADPGQTATLTFVADRSGSFRFRCNVICGAMHPFMIGRLTVGTDAALYRGIALSLIGALGLTLSQGPTSRTKTDV